MNDTTQVVQEDSPIMVNGINCKGYLAVFLLGDLALVYVEETGVGVFANKEMFADSLTDLRLKIEEGNMAARKELEDLHPIVVHAPANVEEMKALMHPYLAGTLVVNGDYFGALATPADKEKILPFKAFDLMEDTIASIGLEKQDRAQQEEDESKGLLEIALEELP